MSRLQFQLESLDGVVRTLQSMAGEHEDMSRSLQGHAGSAQSIGADGWIVDQVRYAASLLGGHPDLFRQLSSELGTRLDLAHQAADVCSGGPTALRAELTLAMTAATGLLKAVNASTKANQRVQVAGQRSEHADSGHAALTAQATSDRLVSGVAKDTRDLFDKSSWSQEDRGYYPDCWHFIKQVMGREGLPIPSTSTIYDWHSWRNAHYKVVAAWGDTSALDADTRTQLAPIPPRGSFVEFGLQTTHGDDSSGHHSAYYMGQKSGVVYLAESNVNADSTGHGGSPPAVHAYKDGLPLPEYSHAVGKTLVADPVPADKVPTHWDPDDANSRDQLHQVGANPNWFRFGTTATFYQPE